MKIFVSYTTKDHYIEKEYLYKKYNIISVYGRTYIDLLHNNSTDKQRRVHDELISSDILILIQSESVRESKWVKWEITMARKQSIPIVSLEPDFATKDLERKFRNLTSLRSPCACFEYGIMP